MRSRSRLSLAVILATLVVLGLLEGLGLSLYSSYREGSSLQKLSEVEKYQAATHNFKEKYGYLPGDLPSALALQMKFKARSGDAGRGDGNGLVEGIVYSRGKISGSVQTGEPFFFWEDLNSALLIQETFNTASDAEPGKDITDTIGAYLPSVKAGDPRNRIYVYSENNMNYFGVSAVIRIDGNNGFLISRPGLSVQEAYNIDKKVDDGNPDTGKVTARFVNTDIRNAAATSGPTATSCSDASTGGYSLDFDDGKRLNCALSFQIADQ